VQLPALLQLGCSQVQLTMLLQLRYVQVQLTMLLQLGCGQVQLLVLTTAPYKHAPYVLAWAWCRLMPWAGTARPAVQLADRP
jgi:hypothetical protein